MKMENKNTENGNMDFQYMMQDISVIYLGAKYTFNNLMENEDVPFRFRSALGSYVLGKFDETATIEDSIRQTNKGELPYMMWKQLKIKVKMSHCITEEENSRKAGTFKSEVIPFSEAFELLHDSKNEGKYFMEEIAFSKLRLMTLSL